MDRDTKFCESFRSILQHADVDPVKLPARSPHLNAHMERFMRGVKNECLSNMMFFGEKAMRRTMRRAVHEFLEHYHQERNHRGLGNRLIEPDEEGGRTTGEVRCCERLGGLRDYYRDAA